LSVIGNSSKIISREALWTAAAPAAAFSGSSCDATLHQKRRLAPPQSKALRAKLESRNTKAWDATTDNAAKPH
jgi:hypothetical protein